MSAEERPTAVVVGVDGTPAAHAALEWAAEAAARRGAQLRIVHGMGEDSVVAHGAPEHRLAVEEARRYARGLLDDGADLVRGTHPGVDVVTVLAAEDAPEAVMGEARHGDVIVVGSRGLGAVRAMLHGSMGPRATSEAPCPVVFVPAHEDEPTPVTGPPAPKGRIVVGVDGSDSSRRALRFGLNEALLSGASVEVVNSWEVPLPADVSALEADAREAHEEVFDRQSEEIVAGVLAEVIDDRTENLDISAVRMQADPVEALLEAGRDADLIVVGSRGRGGVSGLLLGSVSQGVLHRALVPVAVLPPHSEDTD
ncbi:universal stress protein [Nocardiopsis sp. FIRDI 009]|uniref:universal stress protein n=1 Tax=Nocardiopsis sp. FIRDI 009 TaxID=714197 RepID=UPI000E228496|nr:universal stress protein [Nocardiopsis sp. FIRDI 009]